MIGECRWLWHDRCQMKAIIWKSQNRQNLVWFSWSISSPRRVLKTSLRHCQVSMAQCQCLKIPTQTRHHKPLPQSPSMWGGFKLFRGLKSNWFAVYVWFNMQTNLHLCTFHHFPCLSMTFHDFPSLSITFHHCPPCNIHWIQLSMTTSFHACHVGHRPLACDVSHR